MVVLSTVLRSPRQRRIAIPTCLHHPIDDPPKSIDAFSEGILLLPRETEPNFALQLVVANVPVYSKQGTTSDDEILLPLGPCDEIIGLQRFWQMEPQEVSPKHLTVWRLDANPQGYQYIFYRTHHYPVAPRICRLKDARDVLFESARFQKLTHERCCELGRRTPGCRRPAVKPS